MYRVRRIGNMKNLEFDSAVKKDATEDEAQEVCFVRTGNLSLMMTPHDDGEREREREGSEEERSRVSQTRLRRE